MPGGDIYTESLEERIERIRKRDEEIEKRHREAEADRLAALQANALVRMTAPDDDDWPKAHKYDKLDFTYDVKEENVEDVEKKTPEEPRMQRPFKKFPEGQGPPADPTYNFLADAERDGKVPTGDKPIDSKKDWRANNNNNGTGTGLNRRSNNNNSFNRGKSGAKAKATNSKGAKQQSPTEEMSSRKSDSDRSSEEKMKRNKSIEGNWRKESIEEKKIETIESIVDDHQQKPKNDGKIGSNDSSPKAANKLSIQQRLGSKPKTEANKSPEKLSDLSIEKRGNITVSVTKDGEVKSVKLDPTRAIGTGRVGNGSTMRQNVQQEKPVQSVQPQQHSYQPQMMANKVNIDSKLDTMSSNFVISQYQPVTVPQPKQSNVVNGVPFKLPSIQERLTKNRIFFDENLKNSFQNENAN